MDNQNIPPESAGAAPLRQAFTKLLLIFGLVPGLVPGLMLGLLALSLLTSPAVMAQQSNTEAGKVVYKRGKVDIKRASDNRWLRVNSGMVVRSGDTIRTSFSGKAQLMMADETMLHVKRNTQLQVESVVQNAGWKDDNIITRAFKEVSRSVYSLISGGLWARNKNREVRATFKTTPATIGIRGTELTIDVSDSGVTSSVVEGSIEVSNDAGKLVAGSGETVTAQTGIAPSKSRLINPLDAVQWTLAVPPLISIDTLQSADASLSAGQISQIEQGDYASAGQSVRQQLQQDADNVNLRALDAVLDLYQGDITTADSKLGAIPGGNASDLVLRSHALTRLMLGDKDKAVELADAAVSLDSDNAANLIVKAYTQQASFDIEAAHATIDQALDKQPDNSTALLIKAQLQFASGLQDDALDTLRIARSQIAGSQIANSKATQSAMVESLAGFVLMSKRQYDDALTAFANASRMDPSLAEPHMGTGIIAMRQGDAKTALQEISTAVTLEPQRAIFLSYWGKMLYQIRRFDKALDMFAHAEKIDPKDPTPAFYRSIILRDLNRHGEAIASMNEAIAKNDNRAVYRSSFLLDEDMATRNVDLSLLYNQLGLGRWAERKAVAAIKDDYTNSSAHLFLAGALSEEEDRSFGFASEALLARMLMPANVNSFNTFNEYTSLFEKPEFGGQVDVAGGNNGTAAGDVIVYGAVPDSNFAYQAGLFGSTTDGWRDTNFEDTAAAAVLGKWQPSQEHGVFASAQVSQIRLGDKFQPRYEFDDPASPDDRTTLDFNSAELGYNYNPSPGSNFLAYATWQGNDVEAKSFESSQIVGNLFQDQSLYTDASRPYGQLQLQYMRKTGDHQLFAGVLGIAGTTEQSSIDQDDAVNRDTDPAVVTPLFHDRTDTDTDIGFYSIYLQDNWSISDSFTLEAAVYFDRIERDVTGTNVLTSYNNGVANPPTTTPLSDNYTQDEVSPRLGLIWEPTTNQTIRLAAFRYLLPFVSQRIDPTEVAGISVFRNAPEGTLNDEVHAVWEYEMNHGLYSVGAYRQEQSYKADSVTPETEVEQNGAQLGADVLLSRTFGLAANYRYFKNENLTDPTIDRNEHLVTLGLRHQNANGFSAGITQTFRKIDYEDNTRKDEDIPITDFDMLYEFSDKAATVGLQVNNIFDEEFNWVTDQFVFVGRNPAREFLVTGRLNF